MGKLFSYNLLKSAYLACPGWVKSLYASIPFPIRAGSVFRNTTRIIEETDFADRETLDRLQAEALQRLIRHSLANVPHYRQIGERIGLRPEDIREPSDLIKLPLLSKIEMQQHGEQFFATAGVHEPFYVANTGGSSGTPFQFRQQNSMYPIEQAYILAQWKRVGYSTKHRKITLRGHVLQSGNRRRLWRYNPIYNEMQLSSYHLDAESIAKMLPEIERFRPTFIHGYPSAIALFLQTIADHGMRLPADIQGVLCASEPLHAHQRSLITDLLGCRVYSFYGQSERVILAGECEYSEAYHVFPLYGITELIDDQGDVISTPGVEGEIIGTSLYNFAMPFIRYRTNDRGIYDTFDSCRCGRRHVRLKSVTGRCQDFVYTRSGKAVPVTAFVFGQHFQAFESMYGMQLHQEIPGELVVRVKRRPCFRDRDADELRTKMQDCVDRELDVRVEYVEQLQTTAAGKTPFVIQQVTGVEYRP